MPTHSENGLSLRWDEPDLDAGSLLAGWSRIAVAVRPRHVSNVVQAVYRVDLGAERMAFGHRLASLASGDEDLYAIDFPPVPSDAIVQYLPRLSCSDRAADPRRGSMPWTVLRAAKRSEPAAAPQPDAQRQAFEFKLDFLARVTVGLDRKPVSVGETPDGLRIDFRAARRRHGTWPRAERRDHAQGRRLDAGAHRRDGGLRDRRPDPSR